MQFSAHLLFLFNSGLSILRVGNALQSNIGMWMHAMQLTYFKGMIFCFLPAELVVLLN